MSCLLLCSVRKSSLEIDLALGFSNSSSLKSAFSPSNASDIPNFCSESFSSASYSAENLGHILFFDTLHKAAFGDNPERRCKIIILLVLLQMPDKFFFIDLLMHSPHLPVNNKVLRLFCYLAIGIILLGIVGRPAFYAPDALLALHGRLR